MAKVVIQCEDGPQTTLDAVLVPHTPFAITRVQASTFWGVTHIPTGMRPWPAAWTDQDAAISAVVEWWGGLPYWAQLMFSTGTVDQIVESAKPMVVRLHRTADVNILDRPTAAQ